MGFPKALLWEIYSKNPFWGVVNHLPLPQWNLRGYVEAKCCPFFRKWWGFFFRATYRGVMCELFHKENVGWSSEACLLSFSPSIIANCYHLLKLHLMISSEGSKYLLSVSLNELKHWARYWWAWMSNLSRPSDSVKLFQRLFVASVTVTVWQLTYLCRTRRKVGQALDHPHDLCVCERKDSTPKWCLGARGLLLIKHISVWKTTCNKLPTFPVFSALLMRICFSSVSHLYSTHRVHYGCRLDTHKPHSLSWFEVYWSRTTHNVFGHEDLFKLWRHLYSWTLWGYKMFLRGKNPIQRQTKSWNSANHIIPQFGEYQQINLEVFCFSSGLCGLCITFFPPKEQPAIAREETAWKVQKRKCTPS